MRTHCNWPEGSLDALKILLKVGDRKKPAWKLRLEWRADALVLAAGDGNTTGMITLNNPLPSHVPAGTITAIPHAGSKTLADVLTDGPHPHVRVGIDELEVGAVTMRTSLDSLLWELPREPTTPPDLVLDAGALVEADAAVRPACSEDSLRGTIACLHIEPNAITATNGHRLHTLETRGGKSTLIHHVLWDVAACWAELFPLDLPFHTTAHAQVFHPAGGCVFRHSFNAEDYNEAVFPDWRPKLDLPNDKWPHLVLDKPTAKELVKQLRQHAKIIKLPRETHTRLELVATPDSPRLYLSTVAGAEMTELKGSVAVAVQGKIPKDFRWACNPAYLAEALSCAAGRAVDLHLPPDEMTGAYLAAGPFHVFIMGMR